MQILGKRSKILLIAVAITMLVAVGVSFAMWDMNAVKATNGELSTYANAKVGDIVTFGQYYQTLDKDANGEYIKTPIEWIVVDKDERTGQLTLMSKYILACGSYFGNYYAAIGGTNGWNYSGGSTPEVDNIPYNQAYIDSTVRAYLNNLERLDMGGDSFDVTNGYIPSGNNSDATTGLLSSVGFSNQIYWTGVTTIMNPDYDAKEGIYKRPNKLTNRDGVAYYEFYYQRPINSDAYKTRPATKGFLDEAFSDDEKSMIVPKVIAGYTGHRWPSKKNDISTKSYVEGAIDKVWLPSATELNIMKGLDWNSQNDSWANPSDEAGSTVFEYFRNLEGDALKNALTATRTNLAEDGKAGNYSIPVYDKGTTNLKTAISNQANANSSDNYWTRTPMSYWYNGARVVSSSGLFMADSTSYSHYGARPCVILKY